MAAYVCRRRLLIARLIPTQPLTTPTLRLRINPAKKDIDSFVFEDFTIEGYDPHETIKMKMAV